MSISPAITTGIICSEYKNETNQFIFISKNSDFNSTEDYHLNIYNNSNKTMLRPMPLTKIKNYPNATSLHFGGLCSYAASQSSLYLNFEESTATNSTTTLVYQLQLDNTTSLPLKFEKKALELFDATLSSFLYAAGANDTSNLAYISTSKNRQNSLNLINLDHPRHHSTKNISDFGLLAVGGTKSQSLYFIQSNAVDVYKLDSLQYSHSAIQTNMTLQGLRRGTTGHVFSNNNFTKEYISIYHPNTGQVDIFDIDTLLIKYTPASVSKKGYIDLNTNTTSTIPSSSTVPSFTTLPSSATTSNTVTQPSFASRLGGTIDKRDDTDNQSKRSQLKVFSNKFYLKSKISSN
ncbi:hypothetical protein BD408DRAFT_30120 [Parasitella parasitica]|nr:hypothetical protein BD408DRAFT_30120 [Parasitella parasitica]